MLNQSFRQVFVTNNPTLLANGQTVDNLAVGQVGIVDAKTYQGTINPTYAKNKAIKIVHGTPDLSGLPLMDGTYDQNEYSKLIVGKNIVDFRGKAAQRGQNQVITIGYSGDVSDTDTIFANAGEQRSLYLTLTGAPIDVMFSKQGITRFYTSSYPVNSDCVDVCAEVDRRQVAEDFVNQINSDTQINRYIRASVIEACNPDLDAPTTRTIYLFNLTVPDTQGDIALGQVQAQYPTLAVKRLATQGILSIYQVQRTVNTLPAAFSNAGTVVISDCPTCPTGYTLTTSGFAYTLYKADAGDSSALAAVNTQYSLGSGDSTTRISYENGYSTYVITSNTALTQSGAGTLVFQGDIRNSCVLTSPTTTAWTAAGTLTETAKEFRLTVGDDICGNNRLAELQALYPDYVISIVDASGTCVHTYSTDVYSNAVDGSCAPDQLTWTRPPSFEGVQWKPVADAALPDGTVCLLGIRIETAFVSRKTNECTFDYFPYDADTVHVTASTFNPNYNDSIYQSDWVVKQIQTVRYPSGTGEYVKRDEKKSLGYALKDRSFDPVVREAQGYSFQANGELYYDEYSLEYEFKVLVGGWGQKETYRYTQVVYFPEGYGKAFENAINGYLASANIAIDPVVL